MSIAYGEKQSLEKLNKLPKVTQLMAGIPRIQNQIILFSCDRKRSWNLVTFFIQGHL